MIEKRFKDYENLIREGKTIDVINQFYSDSIVQFENNSDPFTGKEFLMKMELDNLKNVKWISIDLNNVVISSDNEIVWGEMIIDYENNDSQKFRLKEAFQQKWQSGKIIEQRFYYDKMNLNQISLIKN